MKQIIHFFNIASNYISRISAVIGSATIIILTILITVEVLVRSILGKSIYIAFEMSGYGLVVITCIGFSYTEMVGGHVAVNFITKIFSPSVQKTLHLVVSALSTIFLAWLTWITSGPAIDNFNNNVVSTILHFPMWLPYSFVPIGYLMFTIVKLNEVLKGALNLHKFNNNSI